MPIPANTNINRVGPYLVVAPVLMIILGFHGRMFLGSALLGTVAGAVAGLLWYGPISFLPRHAWTSQHTPFPRRTSNGSDRRLLVIFASP